MRRERGRERVGRERKRPSKTGCGIRAEKEIEAASGGGRDGNESVCIERISRFWGASEVPLQRRGLFPAPSLRAIFVRGLAGREQRRPGAGPGPFPRAKYGEGFWFPGDFLSAPLWVTPEAGGCR